MHGSFLLLAHLSSIILATVYIEKCGFSAKTAKPDEDMVLFYKSLGILWTVDVNGQLSGLEATILIGDSLNLTFTNNITELPLAIPIFDFNFNFTLLEDRVFLRSPSKRYVHMGAVKTTDRLQISGFDANTSFSLKCDCRATDIQTIDRLMRSCLQLTNYTNGDVLKISGVLDAGMTIEMIGSTPPPPSSTASDFHIAFVFVGNTTTLHLRNYFDESKGTILSYSYASGQEDGIERIARIVEAGVDFHLKFRKSNRRMEIFNNDRLVYIYLIRTNWPITSIVITGTVRIDKFIQ
ncbi:unnamed protein product [Caenorhabditis bovis]|uniref:Galectin n=1 Tax=Caenorhabditis bovis TaxID=2654633 RepID=A0A8S1F5C5_9PELO|nr:unnamed protein product [Caenorhabditis bovis]